VNAADAQAVAAMVCNVGLDSHSCIIVKALVTCVSVVGWLQCYSTWKASDAGLTVKAEHLRQASMMSHSQTTANCRGAIDGLTTEKILLARADESSPAQQIACMLCSAT
jgi:hypothetical protein